MSNEYTCEVIVEYYPGHGPAQWRECGNVALHTATDDDTGTTDDDTGTTFNICNPHINRMSRRGRESVKPIA